MWASRDSILDIMPNSKLNGFKFKSQGLPTIVKFYARGAVEEPYFPEGEAPSLGLIIGADIFENSKQGYTLGPTSPPKNFVAPQWCDTLSSYTRQSQELGWIKEHPIAEKYLSYFNAVKTNLERDNISTCKAMLKDVLGEVNKDSTNNITSEAYALLRYNTEYLLTQLVGSEVTIEDLIAYINKSYKTGSINNKGIANSLISKLETARVQLDKGKSKQAINALEAFLNELEAQKGKHVTIDVYEYLRENVGAIIEQISRK
jgi:hypothetical protein